MMASNNLGWALVVMGLFLFVAVMATIFLDLMGIGTEYTGEQKCSVCIDKLGNSYNCDCEKIKENSNLVFFVMLGIEIIGFVIALSIATR